MAVISKLSYAEFGPNHHREDASHFMILTCKIGPEFRDKNRMINLRHLQIRSTIR